MSRRLVERYPELLEKVLKLVVDNPGITARSISDNIPAKKCMEMDPMRIAYILKVLKYHNYVYNDMQKWYPNEPITGDLGKILSNNSIT